MNGDCKIELLNISKSFPGVLALDDVTMRVRRGTVHAVVGENGAGKSTLMKIINGLYQPDSGSIVIDQQRVAIKNPMEARHLGIAMIAQELNYFPDLSIKENILMGRFPHKGPGWYIDWNEVENRAFSLMRQQGLDYDLDMPIKYLSVSEIQLLEIIKALSFNASLIIMDEPTSSITESETQYLFEQTRKLKEEGVTFLYISHKLDEVFEIADEITVLRDGRLITTGPISDYTKNDIITAMVGREMDNIYPEKDVRVGETVLEVKDLSSEGLFQGVNLKIRSGEIVGLAGLVGAGRTELARALAGSEPISAGSIMVDGREVKVDSIYSAICHGIIMVPEDRHRHGIIVRRSIRENVSAVKHRVTRGWLVSRNREAEDANRMGKALNLKAPSIETNVEFLSGGNQQKVVLAKWLLTNAKVLILDEPTRGVDVGAKYEIYKIMIEQARQGKAILFISSELPELLGMSDRIYVMNNGRVVGEFHRNEFSQNEIMARAIGG